MLLMGAKNRRGRGGPVCDTVALVCGTPHAPRTHTHNQSTFLFLFLSYRLFLFMRGEGYKCWAGTGRFDECAQCVLRELRAHLKRASGRGVRAVLPKPRAERCGTPSAPLVCVLA